MNAKYLGALLALAIEMIVPAKADYIISTPTVAPASAILQIVKSGTLGGNLLPWMNLVDATGTPLGTSSNPLSVNCLSGCSGGGGGGGTSSNFNATFPSAGTALGISNGTNMVPLTLGQAVAASSLPVVLPTAQITALTPPTSVGLTGSLPAFAATPTVNLGTLGGAATQTTLASVLTALGTPFQAGGSIGNTSFGATQSGPWNINNIAGTISLPTGAGTAANQATIITALNTLNSTAASPISTGTNTIGAVTQASGPWQVQSNSANLATQTTLASILTALGSPFQAGASIANTSFGISGTLPAFASTPTVNLGTLGGAATQTTLASVLTALGTPFQAGGSIGNTSFGISGTLPAFASTPTVNLGTLGGAATAANQIVGTNYGNQANWLSGTSGNVTGTTQTTVIAAPGSGKIYVTALQCFNTGATTSTITLNDGAATPVLNPAGAGVVQTFPTPLIVPATTALKMTPGSSSTNQWCNAQGYNAT
jgi:hypothetical protein